jgi:competence protein ComEA
VTDDDTTRLRLADLHRATGRSPGTADAVDPLHPADPLDPVDGAQLGHPGAGAGEVDLTEPDRESAASLGAGSGYRFAAFDPGSRGVKALAAVAVVVVVVAGFLTWRSRPQVDPVAAPQVPAAADPAANQAGAGQPSEVTPSATVQPIVLVVAVTGRVHRPGLVTLPAGARVADAVEAAGGALPGTDIAWLNLARPLADGELIAVGVTPPPGVALGPGPSGGGATVGETASGGKVDLNRATAGQLETLPGVGPVLAQRIVEHRERVGGFGSVAELRKVSGIGDTRFEQLRELVTV